jgi:PhnB protein
MKTQLNAYLSFGGNCQEAMEFYKSVFGGKLEMTNYLDGGMSQSADDEKLIMHAMFEADNGITFMASDGRSTTDAELEPMIQLSLSGDDSDELTSYFNKLAENGTVREPLVQAPWGDTFGMLTDQFGIQWMVNISGKKSN